jgi:digeranylgeranylglycerophospholipid reductase
MSFMAGASIDRPVAVVGASVAGLFAAYHLARGGAPVRVYEARPTFELIPRTLIVTPAWLRLLDFDPSEAIINRTQAFELISRRTSVRIPLQEPDLVLERARFSRMLVRKLEEVGGQLYFEHRCTGLENGLRLRFQNGSGRVWSEASGVLGADGAHSFMARSMGRSSLEHVAIRQARVSLPPDLPPHIVRVWFDRQSTRFFYWLIPESAQVGVAGLIADTQEEAQRALDRFLAAHDLETIEYQAAWVPLHPLRWGANAAHREGKVLLVGDAVGQVKVTTVGGVVTGMRGAAAAARSLLQGTSYADELRPLRRELNFHALVRSVLDGFTDKDYDRLLRSVNRRTLDVLGCYNRDELGHLFGHLLLAQPRWLTLGARALMFGTRAERIHSLEPAPH